MLVDINGDALHASLGLPPALNVTTAKVGKLEIIVSNFFTHLIEQSKFGITFKLICKGTICSGIEALLLNS